MQWNCGYNSERYPHNVLDQSTESIVYSELIRIVHNPTSSFFECVSPAKGRVYTEDKQYVAEQSNVQW